MPAKLPAWGSKPMPGGNRKTRIIGGKWRHSYLRLPPAETTRPISDRAKEALFNILGDISGLAVLDAYAGSGSLGFEALSRGAKFVEAIERDQTAAETIRRNTATLQAGSSYQLHQTTLENWLEKSNDKFDLIFADPPFDKLDGAVVEELSCHLQAGGTLVLKHSSSHRQPQLAGLTFQLSRRYGTSMLSFYQ